MKRTSQMLNSRLIRKQIKAAGGQQIERAGGDQDSIKELASEVGKNTDELRRQREALAEAKGDANKKPPAPIVIDGSVSSVITSPTSQAISTPRQLKSGGTTGAIARGDGSMVGANP
jgi:HAMP domain-containing protein